jgi:MFS-type transporter involved in bile tolerance (Atg22 family)
MEYVFIYAIIGLLIGRVADQLNPEHKTWQIVMAGVFWLPFLIILAIGGPDDGDSE